MIDREGPSETNETPHDETRKRIILSLSGGGYRATMFGAGALLAIADSRSASEVLSISSVSGGSLASAVTIGGFSPTLEDPDPMGRRVALLAGLVRSRQIATEDVLKDGLVRAAAYASLGLALVLVWPAVLSDPEFGRIAGPIVVIALLGLATLTVAVALTSSWYGVQAAVESLVAEGRRVSSVGTTLGESADIEGQPTRIFCATDLSSGSHVYITPTCTMVVDGYGLRPRAYLADVVAASACFPGFRPVVFQPAELGLSDSSSVKVARRRIVGRLLLGILGFLGIGVALAAVLARLWGPLSGEIWPGSGEIWPGLAIMLVLVCAGVGLAVLAGWLLSTSKQLVLVDGGVCDNLGSAFSLLVNDKRYPDLPGTARLDQADLMLVIDAGRPFSPPDKEKRGIGGLFPLRLSGAQRSVLALLGNANGTARKQVIKNAFSASNLVIAGEVLSISDTPAALGTSDSDVAGSEWDLDRGLDWSEIVDRTKSTATTLDVLDWHTSSDLLVHGYRLTQQALEKHGISAKEGWRTAVELKYGIASPTKADLWGDKKKAYAFGLLGAGIGMMRTAGWLVGRPSPPPEAFALPIDLEDLIKSGRLPESARDAPEFERVRAALDAASGTLQVWKLLHASWGPYARASRLVGWVVPLLIVGIFAAAFVAYDNFFSPIG